ncbi:MAG: fibronectin type III domain-containing protein [Eubacterium sp.]|nr:fibronectin type III domain-containing protein [Eubacterium sp.]MBR2279276.1 fibronectin type III domain-containing protein [Eubacterium sp.]
MKKSLSILLSITMLLSVIAGINITSYANPSVCIDELVIYNVTEPVAGEKPDFDYQQYDFGGAYSSYLQPYMTDNSPFHNGISWFDETDSKFLYYNGNTKFVCGHTYTVRILVEVNDRHDCIFDDINYMSATINGINANLLYNTELTEGEKDYSRCVSASFTLGGHSYKYTDTQKASLNVDGKRIYTCKCGATRTEKIAKITSIALTTSTYVYNGKVKNPKIIAKDSTGKQLASSSYFIGYDDGRKNVGTYSVDATFCGDYYGIFVREFKIIPPGTSITSLAAGKKQFTVKWKKQATQTQGYQVQYATNAKFTKAKTTTVKGNKNTKKVVKKLASKKKYYVRVRTYKKVNGINYYSKWTKAKTVKVK